MLAACPPCQGFSTQRRGAGKHSDKRNRLVFEFVRLVREVRPAYFLLENVPGLAEGAGQPLFGLAKKALRRLGYGWSEGVLDAADFGVPQHRKRLIVVGGRRHLPRARLPAPTHISPDTLHAGRGLVAWKTVRDVLQGLTPLGAGQADTDDPLHSAPAHNATTLRRIQAIPADGGSRRSLPSDLILACHKGHSGHYDVYGRMPWDRPAPTLTGGCNKPSKGRFLHPEQQRAITLREAALLQSFPPKSHFVGSRDSIAAQIGNAVPPDLSRAVAAELMQLRTAYVRSWLPRRRLGAAGRSRPGRARIQEGCLRMGCDEYGSRAG